MNIYARAYSRKHHSWSCRAEPGSETETGKVGMQPHMPALVTTGFMKQLRLTVKWKVILFHRFKEFFEAWNKLQKSHNYRRRKTTFPRIHNATATPPMHLLWLLVPAFTQAATAESLIWTEAVACTFTFRGLRTAGKLSLHCSAKIRMWLELIMHKKAMSLPHPPLSHGDGVSFHMLVAYSITASTDLRWQTKRLLVCL